METKLPSQQREDKIQERIIRGMIFNNLCTLLSKSDEKLSLKIQHMESLCEELYKKMAPWLRGEK